MFKPVFYLDLDFTTLTHSYAQTPQPIVLKFGKLLSPDVEHQCAKFQVPADRLCLPVISTAFEAWFCTTSWKCFMISNVIISECIHPNVIIFWGHVPVNVLWVPTEFHAHWFTRFWSSKWVVPSRSCIFGLLCSDSSERHISASRDPILLRFGQDVTLDVLLKSTKSQVIPSSRYRAIRRVVACCHQKKGNEPDANLDNRQITSRWLFLTPYEPSMYGSETAWTRALRGTG